MEHVKLHSYKIFNNDLKTIKPNTGKIVVNTINAHSYIVAEKDNDFKEALVDSDYLLPDGEGIVLMVKKLQGKKIKKIAGADAHLSLLEIAEKEKLKCFYLGSSDDTLQLINKNLSEKYKNIKFGFFSPPFKKEFSNSETLLMVDKVNEFEPDILFIGMTAPKQEKWVHENKSQLNASVICSIGAVFDFIAETKKRAPKWVIENRLEWLYRSFTEWRLTKRYLYSTPLFLLEIFKLKYFKKNNS